MILHVHSDASYLSASRSINRVGGHFFLSNKISEGQQIRHNGDILVIAAILKNVIVSAEEAYLGGLFLNGKEAVDLRDKLQEMVNLQNEPTPIQIDNSTAMVITNNTIKQRRSKSIDMIFHLVRDRTTQKKQLLYWRLGDKNLAAYHTKFHFPAHHKKQLPIHVQTDDSPTYIPEIQQLSLRECVN